MQSDRYEQYKARARQLCQGVQETLNDEFPEYETYDVKASPRLRRAPKPSPVSANPTKPQAMNHDD